MDLRRLVVGGAVATLSLLGVVVAPAYAGTVGEPIFADVTGDGRVDRITLIPVDDVCGVSVERGLAPDRYDSPRVHSYRLSAEPGPHIYCPDMGVAVDLGGDGSMELVVAWFHGPVDLTYQLLVLRNFQPHAMIESMRRPGGIRTIDLDNDGLLDVWESTDDPDGLITFRNTPAGTLERGPLGIQGSVRDSHFADFDGDGLLDLVAAYVEGRHWPPHGVAVVLDDGTRVQLNGDQLSQLAWSVAVIDADRNGRPDVQSVITADTDGTLIGVHTTFINRGGASFVVAPVANDELAHAYRATPKVIKVRDNDWASRDAALTIVTPPKYGRLTRTDPRYEIVYERDAAHNLADMFVYRLSQDGRSDTATVTVKMKD